MFFCVKIRTFFWGGQDDDCIGGLWENGFGQTPESLGDFRTKKGELIVKFGVNNPLFASAKCFVLVK